MIKRESNIIESTAVMDIRDHLSNHLLPIELPYKKFKKIIDACPFTLVEWAGLLQISDRTLHRYAKDGIAFNNILTERILLVEKLCSEGKETFGTHFKEWLNSQPLILVGKKPMDYLYTHDGILFVYRMMMQIQHGVYV